MSIAALSAKGLKLGRVSTLGLSKSGSLIAKGLQHKPGDPSPNLQTRSSRLSMEDKRGEQVTIELQLSPDMEQGSGVSCLGQLSEQNP